MSNWQRTWVRGCFCDEAGGCESCTREKNAGLAKVDAVIAAYEAFVAAQAAFDKRVAKRDEHYRRMTKREALGCFIAESPDRQLDASMCSQIASLVKARDKARDEVMAAVAALAGRGEK